jgi:predicted XRE-type DNA-binding protein
MAKKETDPVVTVGSGNVFADLGRPNAEELKAKVRLAFSLNSVLEKYKLTTGQAAKILGTSEGRVIALKEYKLEVFSLQRLMRFATALEHDVVIEIRPRTRKAAKRQLMAHGAA